MAPPAGFAAFAEREHPRLVGALTLYTGDPALARELAQDALVRCRERWTRVSAADRPGAYAHRTAINLANSRFRRRAAERRAVARVAAESGDGVHRDPDAADALAVRRAVAALPPRQREVVVRRWFLDESVADVAAAMGVRASTVRSTAHRAVEALRGSVELVVPDDVTQEAHDGA